MKLVHLTRKTPEKGYTNTEMDCQEEHVEKFIRRGWIVADSEKPAKDESSPVSEEPAKDADSKKQSKNKGKTSLKETVSTEPELTEDTIL